jgi:hypothetical protein
MNPAIKPDLRITLHRDNTISYWSVFRQQWVREPIGKVLENSEEMSAMNPADRQAIGLKLWK